MKIKIRIKLFGSFIIVNLLFIAIGWLALDNIQLLRQNVEMTHDHPLTVTKAAVKIEFLITAIHRSMKNVTLSSSHKSRAEYIRIVEQNESAILEQFNIIHNKILGEEGRAMVIQIRLEFLNWRPIRHRIIDHMDAGNFEQAREITMNEGYRHVQQIIAEMHKIEDYAAKKTMVFNKSSSQIAHKATRLILLLIIGGSIICLLIAGYLSFSISKRISLLNSITTKITAGDLNQAIQIKSSDEIGLLASNLNVMAEKLKQNHKLLETQIQKRTKDLELSNLELKNLQKQLESSVNERTNELDDKVKKLDKSKRAMLYMVEDLNRISKELKLEQHKLELANKDLEAFAYSISHDLRAPLRHIDGFTRLLKPYLNNEVPDAEAYFNRIRSAVTKMSAMIDSLLKFSRLGRKEIRKIKIDSNIIIRQVVDQYIDNEKNKIQCKISELPEIYGDPVLLQMVFENLINNAIKFSSEKKPCKIDIGYDESSNEFFVKDNGIGLKMEYADKLFGVFQRLHTEEEYEGLGIGLANVKQIINKHGGTIRVDAEPDKGATFFLHFPKHTGHD